MLAASVLRRIRGNAVPWLRKPYVPCQRVQTRRHRQSSWNDSVTLDNTPDNDRRSSENRDRNHPPDDRTQCRPPNHFHWTTSSRSTYHADRPVVYYPRKLSRPRPTNHLNLGSAQSPASFPFELSNPTITVHPGVPGKGPDALLSYRTSRQAVPEHETLVDKPGVTSFHPMLTWVQIASVPTADTPGAHVVMHFDNRRYLFGQVAEGAQRNMIQRRIGLAKMDELFISGPVRWQNVGGLMGMILTIADVVAAQKEPKKKKKKKQIDAIHGQGVVPSLKIHGAENLNYMLATARRFIFRKGLPLRVHEVEHQGMHATGAAQERKPDFEDSNISVWYVSLMPDGDTKESHPSRKRCHDDMVSESDPDPSKAAEQVIKDRVEAKNLVKSVVNHMFDSGWALDALVQSQLHEVKFPASIFVKGDDGKLKKYDGPLPGGNDHVPDIPVFVHKPWVATNLQHLPSTSPSSQALSYIVKGHTRRGKFKPDIALKHGVHKSLFKLLTAGATVKGSDGQDVTPEMCLEPSIEGRGFAFIDLPDASYISPFLARPEWADAAVMHTLDVFYWNLGRGVAQDERLLAFMKNHGKIRHHVFSLDVNPNRIALHTASAQIINLHLLDPDRFSLPVFDNRPKTPTGSSNPPYKVSLLGSRWKIAPRPEQLNDEVAKDLNPGIFHVHPSSRAAVNRAKATLADPNFQTMIERTESDIPHRDLEIIPLGTGSALPSRRRNVSATLIRIPGVGAYLFDCGENTLGQLRRMYGYQRTDEILSELKCIWISHMHADHHLGLASVIRAWYEVTVSSPSTESSIDPRPRLTVTSHWHMNNWLREYSQVEDIGLSRLNLIDITGPVQRDTVQNPILFYGSDATATGLERVDAVRVDHCHGALACVFTWPSGLKIAFSGDCRPSRVFAEVAADCTLLLHEATLDDELHDDAIAKKHCTVTEAMDIAWRMRARRVLLTHFSQRYPKFRQRRTEQGAVDGTVTDQVTLMAFDQMHVKLGDFKKAELFLPALQTFLTETIAEDDDSEARA